MNKTNHKLKYIFKISLISVFFIHVFSITACTKENNSEILIVNPYNHINWKSWWQYKSSLHTHTNVSDGWLSPNDLVDAYKKMDYKILAITDHNNVTYPWESFVLQNPSNWAHLFYKNGFINAEDTIYHNRCPVSLGMIAVRANELSNHHHLGSYFSGVNTQSSNIHNSLNAIRDKDGLAVLFHPIKYFFNVDWYRDLFADYEHLVGMEVYNRKYDEMENFYYDDFHIWDSLLSIFMPDRNILGFANDDHHTNEMGHAYNVFLMPEFSLNWFKKSMERGKFYYVVSLKGHSNLSDHPVIEEINVNNKSSTISIKTQDNNTVKWIYQGNVISKGESINISEISNNYNYIRAVIYNNDKTAFAGTQAFGIKR